MKMEKILETAEDNGIIVDYFFLNKAEALSLCTEFGYFIAIDPLKLKGHADEIVKLGHELGHCLTGSFYCPDNYFDISGRHEYRANKWAVLHLIPYDDLIDALKRGIDTPWDLAEFFDVTEQFICYACDFYASRSLIDDNSAVHHSTGPVA